ncbi:MAG: hypothetical protein IKJ27_11145 [Clostridia bacterium]|nr:hypothetical protein [Clostridia bacterium]
MLVLHRESSGTVVMPGEENWLERNSEDMHIVSDDGINLHGYFINIK